MFKKTVILGIQALLFLSFLYAEDLTHSILKSERHLFRSVLIKSEDTYLYSKLGGPYLSVYSENASIKGGYDFSQFENSIIPRQRKRFMTDFDRIKGQGIYALLVGSTYLLDSTELRQTPEALILKFSDSDNFSDPTTVSLDIKVAADRLRADAEGNFYLLGLDEDGYRNTIMNQIPGEYPLLHKFGPDGEHIYSTLIRPVDATKGKFIFSYTSPLLAPSNIAVTEFGEVWILWANLTGEEEGFPATTLYKVNINGETNIVYPSPPATGYTLIGLVKNLDTFDVLFEWKRYGLDIDANTILASPDGTIIFRENIIGRVLSVDNDSIITTAFRDDKHHLSRYFY